MERVRRPLWILVAAGLVVYLGLTVWLAFSALFFPYQLDYGEGIVLWFARQLARGEPIYNPLGPPYASSNYPPVLLLLAGALDSVFGASYTWGRWLNLAATLVTTAFVARLVWGETRGRAAAALAALFFIGSTFVYHWVPLFRVDMPGVAFTMAGIFFVWCWERKRGRPAAYLVLAALFFLLGLYTKHSLLFAPAAAIAAIFLRDRRASVIFALAMGLVGGALFVALEAWTRGGWSFGLVTSNATVWSPGVFATLISSFALTYAVLIGLAVWSWWQRVTRLRWRVGVLEVYGVAALASLILAGREGAWENYLFEAVVMVCVFAGLTLAVLLQAPRWRIALPVLLVLQLVLFWNEHDPRIATKLFDQVRSGNAVVGPLVRAANGTVISEDMGLLVTNGKPVEYYTFPYSTLARAGRWDQSWELENLRSGAWPLVILLQGTRTDLDRFGNFTRAFVSALDYGYELATNDHYYQVYTPAALEHLGPRANFGEIIELVGWSFKPNDAGKGLVLSVVWRARQQPRVGYTTFAHVEDVNGGVIAQDDHAPGLGAYPTTRWADGEMVRETYRLNLPEDMEPGEYFLRVGWYDTETLDRLGMPDGTDMVELERFVIP
jgi:hypothetical protein